MVTVVGILLMLNLEMCLNEFYGTYSQVSVLRIVVV